MSTDDQDVFQRNLKWREARLERCRDPNGWLTLIALHWLAEGSQSLGRDGTLPLPPPAPPLIGTFTLADDQVVFEADPSVEVTLDGARVARVALRHDGEAGTTALCVGPLTVLPVRRGAAHRWALRVKDRTAPTLRSFTGIPMYPRFVRPTALGEDEDAAFVGHVLVTVAGHEIDVDVEGDVTALELIFRDATAPAETYGGGRYLQLGPVAADGTVLVDFNAAYNPPCCFTDFATCPYPHARNRLAFRVEAGEQRYVAPHPSL